MIQRIRQSSDRGESAIMLVVAVTTMILAVGFVVDGGGKLQADDSAQYAAEQAARAAGQEIDAVQAGTGTVPAAQASAARAAAHEVLSATGASGSVTITGTQLTVRAQTTYSTKLLGVIGIGRLDGNGEANAEITRGITQGDQ